MICGEPSARSREQRLSWRPRWVWLLLPATPLCSALPFLIALFVTTRTATLAVTFCTAYCRHWVVRGWAAGLLWTAALGPVAAANFRLSPEGWAAVAALFVPAIAVTMTLRLTELRIRAVEDGWFSLTNVAPGFAAAVGVHRACPTCDYDLRGNVSGRCPECGHAVNPGDDPAKVPGKADPPA
jgi:hypothetical protein